MGYSNKKNQPPVGGGKVTVDTPSSRRSFRVRPVAIAAIVAILAAVAFLVVRRGTGNDERETADSEKKVQRQRPARSPQPPPQTAPKPPEPPKKDYSKLDNIALRRLPASETNNLTEAQVKYWKMFHPWPPPDENQPRTKHGKYHIFESRADNEIAFVLATEPGTMVLGNRSVGPDFERRFLKSLERPIIVSKDDSDYDRELKRAVIDAKIELKAAYDRGEDIGKIMDEARDELQRLARYRAQVEKEALKMMHRPGATAQDADATIEAVNKMLEAKGMAPIELNSMSRLAMKYQRMKSATNNE